MSARNFVSLYPFSTTSFFSIWYWVLLIFVWTLVCHRTLGVPYDMLLRARRLPDIAARVEGIAQNKILRIGAVYDRAGPALAAAAGFGLSGLGVVGFGVGHELALAVFMLLFPLAVVSVASVWCALRLRRRSAAGRELLRAMSWLRLFNHMVGLLTFAAIAVLSLWHLPRTAFL